MCLAELIQGVGIDFLRQLFWSVLAERNSDGLQAEGQLTRQVTRDVCSVRIPH